MSLLGQIYKILSMFSRRETDLERAQSLDFSRAPANSVGGPDKYQWQKKNGVIVSNLT